VTTQVRPPRPDGSARGAQRFAPAPQQERRESRAKGVVSALLLLVVVVGVPVGLVLLDGVPGLPTSWPTRDQLTQQIGVEQLLTVLLWVVWLAWLQFTVCVVVELVSGLRGVGLPQRVPLAGPSQRAARVLVASVLVLLGAAVPATAAVPAATGAPVAAQTQVVAPAEVAPQAAEQEVAAPDDEAAPVVEGERTYHLGDVPLTADEADGLVGKRVLVVQPPEGRYHDNLWDIAQRHLGDGRRYQEIFELNKGRDQPDGRELTLARLIQPGWLMVMPEDATGVDRVTVEVAPVEALEAAPEAPVQGAGGSAAAAQADDGAAVAATTSSAVQDDARSLAGAGLLAAGLLASLELVRRRRRTGEPSDPAVEMEVALRVGADPGRARRLDRSLRQLAAACAAAGRPLPSVYAATIDDTALELRLSPADTVAPAPWRAAPDGRTWTLPADAPDPGLRPGVAPFPGLVSLGRDERGADVLVDLEAAQGPVTIVGDPTAAHQVATALAAELATNGWSDALRVTGVALPAALSAVGGDRYRAVTHVDEVVPVVAARQADTLGESVLVGRVRGGASQGSVPEYVVTAATPGPQSAARLVELASGPRAPWGLVSVGDVPGARWRIQVDADGGLTLPALGLAVSANRLSEGRIAALGELLDPPEPTPGTPGGAVEVEGHLVRPEVEAPAGVVDLASAPVRVRVLGRPVVEAAGPLEDDRRDVSTELVVHLALHPQGLHPTVLGAAVWPRGVTTAVLQATVERARTWLGSDAHGTPYLQQGPDGHLRLAPEVALDWDVVRTWLARSRTATDVAEERAALWAALRLVRGAPFADITPGRYSWLARVRLEREIRTLVVDAAHRLAVLGMDGDDPAGARAAAEAGLVVAPTDELLWRDLLRAAHAVSGAEGVHRVAGELERTLHAADAGEVSAETAALVEELVPQARPGRAAGAQA